MKKLLMGLTGLAAAVTVAAAIIALPGLMGNNNETVVPEIEEVPIIIELLEEPPEEMEEEPEDLGPDLTGLALNPLTGLYIDEELAARRPIAVVINNIRQALPQSGIAQADVIYEVLAEGGITRMVAVFSEMDSEKIGPVRSNRSYFLDFALNHDSIFVHHGSSTAGYTSIRTLGIDNLDGMNIVGAFFRDQSRVMEHSSYIRSSGIFTEIENRGLRTEIREEFRSPFHFLDDDEEIEGEETHEISVPFAPGSQVGQFEFVPETGQYLRSQNNTPHIDEYTGEQLAVDNVLIQYTSIRVIDNEGRRDVRLVGEGRGTLHTRGVAIPVRWSCAAHGAPTVWTFEDGSPMRISRGKTWICIMGE